MWMCTQVHMSFILYESYGAFLAPYTLHLSLLTNYKYIMYTCNVAHRSLALIARVFAYGRKSSRQRADQAVRHEPPSHMPVRAVHHDSQSHTPVRAVRREPLKPRSRLTRASRTTESHALLSCASRTTEPRARPIRRHEPRTRAPVWVLHHELTRGSTLPDPWKSLALTGCANCSK